MSVVGRARAVALLARGRAASGEERRQAYEAAVAADDTYFRAHSFLGYAVLEADPGAAVRSFTRAVELAPADLGARVGLVRALLATGATEAAIASIEAGLAEDVGQAELWSMLLDVAPERVEKRWSEMWAALAKRAAPAASLKVALHIAVELGQREAAASIAGRLRDAAPFSIENASVFARHVRRPARTSAPVGALGEPPDVPALCEAWEQKYAVDEWVLNGVHVWPMVRGALLFRKLAEARGQASFDRAAIEDPRANARAWLEHWRDARPHDHADVVFFGTSSQRVRLDDVWVDQLIDPVADEAEALGLTTAHLELRADGQRYRQPQRRPSVWIRPAIAGLLRGAPRGHVWEERLDGFEALAEETGSTLSRGYFRQKIHQQLRIADWFERKLRRMHPKVVVAVCYFGTVGWSLLLAARRLGIPTVDLQHGVTSGHPMYERFTRQPRGGFELLPDVFWAWSDDDADRIRDWGGRTVTGGHPWVAYCTDRDPPSELPRGRRTVLITLNWASGFDERFRALIEAAPADWHWWVRLHPKMLDLTDEIRSWCETHARGRTTVDAATSLPLPVVLAAADVHVTMSSTVTQEAARIGIASVTLDPRTELIYGAEMRSGWARCVLGGADDVLAAIDAQADRASSLSPMDPYPGRDAVRAALGALPGLAPRAGATARSRR